MKAALIMSESFYLPNNFAIAVPSSAGESTTVIPQSRNIAFLAAAVSSTPAVTHLCSNHLS